MFLKKCTRQLYSEATSANNLTDWLLTISDKKLARFVLIFFVKRTSFTRNRHCHLASNKASLAVISLLTNIILHQ